MDNSGQILGLSLMAVIFITVIIGFSKGGIAAYGATLAKKDFDYRFDKTKLSTCTSVIILLAALFFVYGIAISKDPVTALEFCLITTFASGLGCIFSICYVPKNQKK